MMIEVTELLGDGTGPELEIAVATVADAIPVELTMILDSSSAIRPRLASGLSNEGHVNTPPVLHSI